MRRQSVRAWLTAAMLAGVCFGILGACDRAPSAAVSGGCKDEGCLDRTYFRQAVLPIFAKHCAACHVPGGSAWGSTQLTLAGAEAWDSLVNKPSLEMSFGQTVMMRVAPGIPESSYLYLKISQANPPVGVRMPAGKPPLAESEIARVKTWILGRPR